MRKQANACISGHAVIRERTHFLRKTSEDNRQAFYLFS